MFCAELQAGRIIEKGPHHELLAKNGKYKVLWETQNRVNE